ncbi:MAG TPA: hypothetical protein VGH87_28535 [Polyangiaceae bacterium]
MSVDHQTIYAEHGTGFESPAPPAAIRTDYEFASVEEAASITGFFFGEAFAERVREKNSARVPECTGVWTARR